MNPRFTLSLARREGRSALRRVGVYMGSITLGVGALVAIHAFRADVSRSVEEQAEVLMGADARMQANRPLPDSLTSVVDSLEAAGHASARVTGVVSMVMAPRTGDVRLLQVRAVEGGWPFYGAPTTEPRGEWSGALRRGEALVDPAVLVQLGIAVGDSLAVGNTRVRVAGTVSDLPTELGFQTAVGPRVWVSRAVLDDAGILGFGSLARYSTFLAIPERSDRDALRERYRETLRATGVDLDLAEQQARSLTNAVGYLGRFLGLVGLGALLLGGIGVASAVHVFVKEKRTTVAVLRCIGATQGSLFAAYLLQAAVLGLAGAAAGVVLGLGVQQALPLVLADLLPVDVVPRLTAGPVLTGLGVGLWVSLLFALVPLLAVRDVPPLRALRQDVEPERRRDPWRWTAWAALGASVVGLSVLEAPEEGTGLAFAAALAATTAVLWAAGWVTVAAARRLVPRRAAYPVRQGVANLFRPQNQTVSVVLALGFGVFVVGTVLQVEATLVGDLALDPAATRPNLLFFDIQPDQVEEVLELLPPGAREAATVTPIVPARVASVNGRTPVELRADTTGPRPDAWTLRREYRNTWRDSLGPAETLVAGAWWDEAPRGTLARISVEADLADDMEVEVGDRITWDFQGQEVRSVITSLRAVDWTRFEPNFFVVFEPGVLDSVPRNFVVLARVEDDVRRASVQRSLVEALPNVSVLDVARIQEAVDAILGRVDQAVRFLAGFSAVAGLLVLVGSLATSRYQRVREGALLKTLGAKRRVVLSVLLTEYVVLGSLAALTGLALSVGAAWALSRWLFEVPYRAAPGALAAVWLAVVALTVAVGFAGSRGLLSRPPLPVLREATE